MADTDTLTARVRSLERALTDADADDVAFRDTERLDELDARLTALENRLDSLDGDVQAVRGLAGELEHVNDAVERRADAALAAADRLDRRDSSRQDPPSRTGSTQTGPPTATPPRESERADRRPNRDVDDSSPDAESLTRQPADESDSGAGESSSVLSWLRALR